MESAAHKATLVIFQLMAHEFKWSKEFLSTMLDKKRLKDRTPQEALSAVAAVALESLSQSHALSRFVPNIVASWYVRAWDAHEKDQNANAEVVYQAYRTELTQFLKKGVPDSVHAGFSDPFWMAQAKKALDERNTKKPKIWELAEKAGYGVK
ncbi:MAG TPA: hypothetical protein VHW01_08990 [Polyangiaceae bacterium]|nr:hypothetical protein [Polyangiaceae bacterium]